MVSLMVLAIGFQLSSIYTPPVTVVESVPVNNTAPLNHCLLYTYVQLFCNLLIYCIL